MPRIEPEEIAPEPLSKKAFADWLTSAEPGERVEYHRGENAACAARGEAMSASDRGLVHLVQAPAPHPQRAHRDFAHFAVRAHPRKG